MCDISVTHKPIQRWIFTFQPNRVLAYIPTRTRVVIPEPIVVQSCFPVLILSQLAERHEAPVALEVEQIAIDVVVGLPNQGAAFVVGLHGAADVVAHNAVTLAANELCRGNIAVGVVNPGDEVVRWLGPVERHLAVFGNYLLRAFRFGVFPFVQDDITIPQVAVHSAVKSFLDPAAKGIVLERDGLAVGTGDAAQHAVRQPSVGVVAGMPSEKFFLFPPFL